MIEYGDTTASPPIPAVMPGTTRNRTSGGRVARLRNYLGRSPARSTRYRSTVARRIAGTRPFHPRRRFRSYRDGRRAFAFSAKQRRLVYVPRGTARRRGNARCRSKTRSLGGGARRFAPERPPDRRNTHRVFEPCPRSNSSCSPIVSALGRCGSRLLVG